MQEDATGRKLLPQLSWCSGTLVGDSVGFTHCSVSANFFISKPFMAHSLRCVSPSADTHMCVYLKSAG